MINRLEMTQGIHNCFVAKDVQDLLRQSYPHLPEEILKNARERCTFRWAEGADTYTYGEEIESICFMASRLLDKERDNFMAVLAPLLKIKQE